MAWNPAKRRFGCRGGGRTWWAHFEITTIHIALTILRKKFEETLKMGVLRKNAIHANSADSTTLTALDRQDV
jgi:hypothetical protein